MLSLYSLLTRDYVPELPQVLSDAELEAAAALANLKYIKMDS